MIIFNVLVDMLVVLDLFKTKFIRIWSETLTVIIQSLNL